MCSFLNVTSKEAKLHLKTSLSEVPFWKMRTKSKPVHVFPDPDILGTAKLIKQRLNAVTSFCLPFICY